MKKRKHFTSQCSKMRLILLSILLPIWSVQGQFVDFYLWSESGISPTTGNPATVSVEDYDGDGRIDILIPNGGLNFSGFNYLYHNEVDSFKLVTLLGITRNFSNGVFGDYDADGDLDLFTTVWQPNSYNFTENIGYVNDGSGNYSLATGLGAPLTDMELSTGVAWSDIDQDGWLDLFVANFGLGFGSGPNSLYHNAGDGTFEKLENNIIATDTPRFSFSSTWADVDNDGDVDLFVANANGPNRLYRNDGSGNFTLDTTPGHFNNTNSWSYSGVWGDFDHDGDFDIYVVGGPGASWLYRNDGNGIFERVTGPWESENIDCTSAAWADFDNDGDLDLLVGAFQDNDNRMYRNDGGAFVLETEAIIPQYDGFLGVADFDNDGDLDVVTANGGFAQTVKHTYVYMNQGNDNNWVQFELRTEDSHNTFAIGTKVHVKTTVNGQSTWQMRQVVSSSHETGSMRLHFGVGEAALIDSVVIECPWNESGVLEGLAVNTIHQLVDVVDQDDLCFVTVTGVSNQHHLEGQLNLSPNPAKEIAQLQFVGEKPIGNYVISLLDMHGRRIRIQQGEIFGYILNIDLLLNDIAPGIYLVKLQAGNKWITQKLVINH